MAQIKNYESRTEEILAPIAESCGVKIYDVEYVKEGSDYYLRSYIDKEGGVTIDDCEKVSRLLSDALDKEDFITDAYIMEVSSPGLGRILKKDRHLEYSLGEAIEMKLYKPLDGSKDFEGVLKAFDKDTVTITMEDGNDKQFVRKDISVMRLKLDIE